MAVDYETLSQGGHAKFAEEIFKKVKARTAAIDDIEADVQAAQAAATTATTKASEASQSATNAAQSATDASDSAAAAAQSAIEAREVSPEGIAEFVDDVSNLKSAMNLLHDEIPNTVQTYVFTDGSVSQVLHKSGNTTVRTDTFTYATNTITEVRTLNTGESLTIVTNLQTLETTVTYAAA